MLRISSLFTVLVLNICRTEERQLFASAEPEFIPVPDPTKVEYRSQKIKMKGQLSGKIMLLLTLKRQDFVKNFVKNCARYCLEQEQEPKLFRIRNRNRLKSLRFQTLNMIVPLTFYFLNAGLCATSANSLSTWRDCSTQWGNPSPTWWTWPSVSTTTNFLPLC